MAFLQSQPRQVSNNQSLQTHALDLRISVKTREEKLQCLSQLWIVSIDSEPGLGSYYALETARLARTVNCPTENLIHIFLYMKL